LLPIVPIYEQKILCQIKYYAMTYDIICLLLVVLAFIGGVQKGVIRIFSFLIAICLSAITTLWSAPYILDFLNASFGHLPASPPMVSMLLLFLAMSWVLSSLVGFLWKPLPNRKQHPIQNVAGGVLLGAIMLFSIAILSGFFEQTNVQSLVDSRTVEEEILYSHPDMDRQRARNICGAMMFTGDDALKKIKVLSGGEKSRVMLGKILATPVNLLLLDEPTNHLDMESCDALLTAIDLFEGTVIMVTHNEMFLHALAERLIVFKNDHIDLFDGSYEEFLEKDGWHDKHPGRQSPDSPTLQSETAVRLSKKEMRRKRSDVIARRSKKIAPLEKRINRLEAEIEAHEIELERLNPAMQKASQDQDGSRIAELSRAIHASQSAIDGYFDELEKVTRQLDGYREEFDRQLKALEQDLLL